MSHRKSNEERRIERMVKDILTPDSSKVITLAELVESIPYLKGKIRPDLLDNSKREANE